MAEKRKIETSQATQTNMMASKVAEPEHQNKSTSIAEMYIEIMKDLSDKLEEALGPYLKEGGDELKEEINCEVTKEYNGERKDVNIARIINPLKYAWQLHAEYMKMMPKETKILFVGMNPSTMSLTGIPFYDVEAMTELLESTRLSELKNTISPPYNDQSKHTSESGERFWRFMREKCGSSQEFLRHCFVINYCPLIFINKDGDNVSLDGFNRSGVQILQQLMHECGESLDKLVAILSQDSPISDDTRTVELPSPKTPLIVGIGSWAYNRLEYEPKMRIRHPSPSAGDETFWGKSVQDELNEATAWTSIMEQIKTKDANALPNLQSLSVDDLRNQ